MRIKLLLQCVALFCIVSSAASQTKWALASAPLKTRWTAQVSPTNALPQYPRPQMVRSNWSNLNGLWEYALTNKETSSPGAFDGVILVPYPIESALSGVKKIVQPTQCLWYRRSFYAPKHTGDDRVLLHFGAVDWQTTVFVNGVEVGQHTGGYDNFSFDITAQLHKDSNEIIVKVYDPTDEGVNPHGKQVLKPKDIWYTPTTGVWQTVWLEVVPKLNISKVKITPDVTEGCFSIKVAGPVGYDVEVSAFSKGVLAGKGKGKTNLSVRVPLQKARLWSPDDPFLYDFKISLYDKGRLLDQVASYGGLRKVEVKKDDKGYYRIFLNDRYTFNLGVLDQGFWPDGIYTAPTDEALAFDIKAIKSMGFNTIRKHIKREPDRWYYWCDKLGLMVWQDMVNPSFNLSDSAKKQFELECKEHIEELYNHPCITTYTLFNEKWGQYDQERLTKWIKQLDNTRLVNGHSGEYLYVNEKLRSPSPNAYIESDLTDVHSYPEPMNALRLVGKVQVLGEFGGIGLFVPDHQWSTQAWGYINVTPSAFLGKYTIMNQHLKLLERDGLSASIYTQPFDVEGEQNGLITYDRSVVKIPLERLRQIHSLLVKSRPSFNQVSLKDADVTDPGIRYSRLLQRYIDGERSYILLKELATASRQAGDKAGASQFSNEYISLLKPPYSEEDLKLIVELTTKTTDAGFPILQSHAEEVNRLYGDRYTQVKMMNIIYSDYINTQVAGNNASPDWVTIHDSVQRFGLPGQEIYLRSKTIFYLNARNWEEFAKAGQEYIDRFGTHIKAQELNQFAWTFFENVSDTSLLLKAADWASLAIQKAPMPQYYDTYANLLYRAGRTDEAIKVQQKALSLNSATGNEELQKTLEKMQKGEPTWK
jgi:tetratricopeptide (TPR) repeat protein